MFFVLTRYKTIVENHASPEQLFERLSPEATVLSEVQIKLFSIASIDCLLIISAGIALRFPNAEWQRPTTRARRGLI